MKKIFLGLMALAIVVSLFTVAPRLLESKQSHSTPSLPVVAITKIAPHPSLDAIEKGMRDEFKEQGIQVNFLSENAQGSIATASQIAQKFVSQNPQLIIPITTPSAQTVYNAVRKTKGKTIPVVFAAISDPVGAKLVNEKTLKGQGITGVSDISPFQQQIELIKNLQPTLTKIGVIYNPGEANAVSLVKKFKEVAEKAGITVIESASPNTNEVVTAARQLITKVEAIYIPNDNTVVSALESVVRSINGKLPIYAADPDSVERGCLAAAALSQYQIGREVGKVAITVLKGANPSDLPVMTPTNIEVTINSTSAKKLGINIPNELLKSSRMTTGE